MRGECLAKLAEVYSHFWRFKDISWGTRIFLHLILARKMRFVTSSRFLPGLRGVSAAINFFHPFAAAQTEYAPHAFDDLIDL